MPPRVLCVTYGGGHANVVIPVLKALETRGVDTLLLALTSAAPLAVREGLEYKSYRDYAHLIERRHARELGERLAVDMHNPALGIDPEESVYYLGINMLENIGTLGETLAREAFDLVGRHSFLAVEFLKKILVEENCTHVVTTNSPRSEKASLIAAGQLGLKTFRIDDLYGVPVIHDSLVRKLGIEGYRQTTGRYRFTPTQSCFLCEYARNNLISVQEKWDMCNVDSSNTTVTGQPAFDVIDEVIAARPQRFLFEERRNLPTVTWAHENGHVDEAEVLELLYRCYARHGNDFNFVIKIRPNLNPLELAPVLERFDGTNGQVRVIHTEMDPNVLIWNSDLLLGQVSTMLTQAAYIGRPIVILDPGQLRSSEPLATCGVAERIDDADRLGEIIESLRGTDAPILRRFRAGCERIGYRHQGSSNVCDLIEQYL